MPRAILVVSVFLPARAQESLAPQSGAPPPYGTAEGALDRRPGRAQDAAGGALAQRLGRRLVLALDDADSLPPAPPPRTGLAATTAAAALNRRVNDPSGEGFGSGNTQMEPALAVVGDTIVCGFTDSRGFFGSGTLSGFAVSFDRGRTWVDGGSLPRAFAGASEMVFGDPTVLTDGRGRWYYLSMYDVGNGTMGPGSGDLGLVLHTGRFLGTSLLWSGPVLVAGGGAGSVLDSPHMALDADRDRLYIAYTNLSAYLQGWGRVEVRTFTLPGPTLAHHVIVQGEVLQQNNAGSRLAVGPDGEVYCAFESGLLSGLGQGPAMQKVARSLDFGASFGTPVVAGIVIESWFNAPPGANREEVSVEFPSIAVDRSDGPNRGRVYLAWQDALQMDFTGTLTAVVETSASNETPETAQVLAYGSQWQISGSLPLGDVFDYYRFPGVKGEHVRMFLQPNAPITTRVRLRCENASGTGADTILAASSRKLGDAVFYIFSLPSTGNYYLQVERRAGSGTYTGWLRKTTSALPSTAIDHRDIVVVSSPDGVNNWTPKVRVNDDTGFTDQAYPEVVVDGCGGVHVQWYDRRYDPRCRALADVVLASSFDGGATFTPNVRVTERSSWWQVPADAIPNFGDYMLPAADATHLFLPWADGRGGDPDVYMAAMRIDLEVAAPDSVRAVVGRELGLRLEVGNPGPHEATLRVQVRSSCSGFPDTTCVLGPVPAGADTACIYSPPVGSWIHQATPCSLFVTVTSDRSACVRRDTVIVLNDQVDAVLQDFVGAWADGAVQLVWRAPRAARFDVERGPAPAGPFARLTPTPIAAGTGGRFVFEDATAEPAAAYAYRLVTSGAGPATIWGPFVVETRAPQRLALHGGHPNPVHLSTRLRFELPRPGRVTLAVYDVRGRRAATLLEDALRPAGLHEIGWDGIDALGKALASGVYVVELRALGERRRQRLVLLR